MLLTFSVENYRSFRAEETLNLLASRRLGETRGSSHCVEVPGTEEHALRVASIYGANGAGKSNLVRALALLERLVLKGTPPGRPILSEPFCLDEESANAPTALELQFLQEGEVFRYGVSYSSNRIHEEWLSVYEGKKERRVFSRVTENDGTVKVRLARSSQGAPFSSKMKALAEVGARPNQLFLTEVVELDDPEAQGPQLRRATEWFGSTLIIIRADSRFGMLGEALAVDESFAGFAAQFLREASTGIADLVVDSKTIARAEFLATAPKSLLALLHEARGSRVCIENPEGTEVIVDASQGDSVTLREIVALHSAKGRQIRLPLHEESDGSRRLLNLLPAFHLADRGRVFVIDELERSMHPMLARKLVEYFLKTVPDTHSQLIFTTHESTLLDRELLRRDGIWFAEKDDQGATHLYSLADFKVRKDLRIAKGYLAGRFGAVPFLGGIDRLIEQQTATEAKR